MHINKIQANIFFISVYFDPYFLTVCPLPLPSIRSIRIPNPSVLPLLHRTSTHHCHPFQLRKPQISQLLLPPTTSTCISPRIKIPLCTQLTQQRRICCLTQLLNFHQYSMRTHNSTPKIRLQISINSDCNNSQSLGHNCWITISHQHSNNNNQKLDRWCRDCLWMSRNSLLWTFRQQLSSYSSRKPPMGSCKWWWVRDSHLPIEFGQTEMSTLDSHYIRIL